MFLGLVENALPVMRAQAESNMYDSITFQRPGATSLDPETGEKVTSWVTYWVGKGRLRGQTEAAQDAVLGGEQVNAEGLVLSVPVAAPVPLVGHRVSVSSTDGPLYVSGVRGGSQLVRRRIHVAWSLGADRG